ncbi:MAG: sigma-70 family RNA polymerase sigma factor [Saprospiraceae bacterium]|nr:sigma-70 family RNA polymerase sigma factor [Saprospiraceae bacterium]
MYKISHIQSNQPDDFACKIYRDHHEAMYLYGVGLCKRFRIDMSLADDIQQETYVRIINDKKGKVLAGYQQSGIAYILTMMHRIMIDTYRRGRRIQRLKEVAALQVPTHNINAWSEQTHIEAFLEAAEKILPTDEFDAIRLYIEGYKLQEIAEIMQTNTTQAHRLVKRAREKLSKHIFDKN